MTPIPSAQYSITIRVEIEHRPGMLGQVATAIGGAGGTIVKVSLEYRPPAGKIGVGLAKLFGEEPQQLVDKDLRRFKDLMERGDISVSQGQGFSSMSNRTA